MAQLLTTFNNITVRCSTPEVATTLLDNPVLDNEKLMLLGLDICNLADSGLTCDVVVTKSSVDYYLLKNAPLPVGGTLQVISKQKHVLSPGDTLKIIAHGSSGIDLVDVIGAYMSLSLTEE